MVVAKIQYRWMEAGEVTRVAEIDRSERIRIGYEYADGGLQRMDVNWDTPAWQVQWDHEHSTASKVKFCRDHLDRNGRMAGAFDDDKLVGIGLIQHEVRERTAQLAFLHVSDGYRQLGIGGHITEMLIREAKRAGARKLVVSATPSGSAVGFYLSTGFKLTDTPIPELFELEPDDIHMEKDI